MGITATEYELLEFFGVEPTLSDPDNPGGWYYNCAVYRIGSGCFAIEFEVSPSYGDVSVVVRNGESKWFEFSARNVDDVRVLADPSWEAVEISLRKGSKILMKTRPNLEITQSFEPIFE